MSKRGGKCNPLRKGQEVRVVSHLKERGIKVRRIRGGKGPPYRQWKFKMISMELRFGVSSQTTGLLYVRYWYGKDM